MPNQLGQKFRNNPHLRQIFLAERQKTPWYAMILCTSASVIPLLVGLYEGQLGVAIFGALCGYLLSLNDHFGPLPHRLWTITLSAIILGAGFFLGVSLRGMSNYYELILFLFGFWIGLLGGDGAELERASVFALICFIVAFNVPEIKPELLPLVLRYALIGYACLIIGGPLLLLFGRPPLNPHASLIASIRKSLTSNTIKHIHAFSVAMALLCSSWLAAYLEIGRGYWVTITVLLVMRPDRMLSLYKTSQRLFGTALGVLVADLIILLQPHFAFYLIVIAICTFSIPLALRRNYWMVAFFVTIFVVMLLELIAVQHGSFHTATLRLGATALGCAISLMASVFSYLLDRSLRKVKVQFKD